jgi:uncharacterized membrane protein YbhN (UPF0104 family)
MISIRLGQIEGLSPSSYQFSVMLPVVIGSIGIAVNMLTGEVDRRKRNDDYRRPRYIYEIIFTASLILIIAALFLGAFLNPDALSPYNSLALPIVAGVVITVAIGLLLPKIYNKVGMTRVTHHSEDTKDKGVVTGKKDDPVIV